MYSQHNEEQFIVASVAGITGRFLDLGAWHPTCFSNTRALYDLGWSGVMLEPSPGCMLSLLEAYGDDPRITLVQAAVSPATELLRLHVTRDAVSTSSEAEYEQWRGTAKYDGCLMVNAVTPAELFARFGGDFEFINIDTEGSSVEVFAAVLAVGVRPRCICLEHNDRIVEANNYAEAANYRQIHLNGTNVIFEWTGARER